MDAIEQPDEPTVAHYTRADASKFPTTPAGQQASAEGMVAALGWTEVTEDHNRRRLAARSADETAADRFRERVLTLMNQFEEERNAEREAVERQYRAVQGTALDRLAEGFHRARSTAERHDLAERIGSSLPLAEAGVIRRVAKTLEATMTEVVVNARVTGSPVKEIAAELDVTPSYVYRILRDNPWEAAWTLYRASGDDEWTEVETGIVTAISDTADDIADQILEVRIAVDLALARAGARVYVWRADEEKDPERPHGSAEYEGDTPLDH